MQPLDLKDFIWMRKSDKREVAIIIAITKYKDEDVIVYRSKDRNQIAVESVDTFCTDFEATYQIGF